MSSFPTPRNIRRGWRPAEITRGLARAMIERACPLPSSYSEILEVRAWKACWGHERGFYKRVDIAFAGARFASVRYRRDGRVLVKFGPGAAA